MSGSGSEFGAWDALEDGACNPCLLPLAWRLGDVLTAYCHAGTFAVDEDIVVKVVTEELHAEQQARERAAARAAEAKAKADAEEEARLRDERLNGRRGGRRRKRPKTRTKSPGKTTQKDTSSGAQGNETAQRPQFTVAASPLWQTGGRGSSDFRTQIRFDPYNQPDHSDYANAAAAYASAYAEVAGNEDRVLERELDRRRAAPFVRIVSNAYHKQGDMSWRPAWWTVQRYDFPGTAVGPRVTVLDADWSNSDSDSG